MPSLRKPAECTKLAVHGDSVPVDLRNLSPKRLCCVERSGGHDTALRGVHLQTVLRDLGLLPVNRVAAAKAGARKARRDPRPGFDPESPADEFRAPTPTPSPKP